MMTGSPRSSETERRAESRKAVRFPSTPLRGASTAFRFLTILPLPGPPGDEADDLSWAVAFYPLVGLVVGAGVAAVLALPLPTIPRAALASLVWVVLPGGLHEDGWMDVLDAAFAPAERARRLEILKDPRVGAHGVSGGVLLLILRFGLLTSVPPLAPMVAAVLARWTMTVSLAFAPVARGSALGASFALRPRWVEAAVSATLLLGVLGVWAGPGKILLSLTVAALLALPWTLFLVGRFGGLTGDGHGAVGVVAEVAALFAFVPWTM